MPQQKENEKSSQSEDELKSSPPQIQTIPHRDPREEKLGFWSEDPKFQ